MNPNFRKVALIAAALGLLVSLFIALAPGGDDDGEAAPATTSVATTSTAPPATTAPPETTTAPPATTAPPGPVRITIDTAEGGIYRGKVKQGREVVIIVRATVTDRAHLHGYDIFADVAPGQPARIELTASIPGQFELELEERHQLIGVLEVRP